MRGLRFTVVPLVLAIVALLAVLGLTQDRDIETWAVVLGLIAVVAVIYGAHQEHVATRAIDVARRRLRGTPFDDLRRELDRARRHERPFALVRVPLGGPADEAATKLLALLGSPDGGREALRTVDRWWRSSNNLFLLLPETTADAARTLMRRVGGEEAASGRWRVAAFPENGLTIGALFEELGARPPRGEDLPMPLVPGPGVIDPAGPLGRPAATPIPASRDEQ